MIIVFSVSGECKPETAGVERDWTDGGEGTGGC